MMWVGGQVDLTSDGEVRNAGDMAKQIPNCIDSFGRVLRDLGGDLTDLVKLLCFYVNDGKVDEAKFLEMVAKALPDGAKPAVTAVPVPYLAYPGMVVEIEGYAMRRADGGKLARTYAPSTRGSPLPQALRARRAGRQDDLRQRAVAGRCQGKVMLAGDIVGQTKQVMSQVGDVLASFGASFDDVVKVNRWYVGTRNG